MKKKIFAALLVAVVVGFSGYNVYQSQKTVTLSDLALANVEALADSRETYIGSGTCWGTGPGFTNVSCPGGYKICCWAHMDVYGGNGNY